ncbi:MAG: 3-hydroxyacyl-ACP dehydratase FabZ family protein [Anaerolineales bacterium]
MSLVILDQDGVCERLPHRGHALFIQEATVEGNRVTGSTSWSAEHPIMQGHFPGQPIVPGVFLIEAAAQLAGVGITCENPGTAGLGMLASVRRALIHRPLLADEEVKYTLQFNANGNGMFSISGIGWTSNSKVITVDLSIAVRVPAEQVEGPHK